MHAAEGDIELIPTREEVAAGRLYTGPAYTQINNFLRAVGRISERQWRCRFAQLKHFTYSCTVGHLDDLVRKGSKTAALEHQRAFDRGQAQDEELLLYRAVGGKLPDSFFAPDMQGMICAIDYGFLSTSTARAASVQFMKTDQPNVLWVLHCKHKANSAGELQIGARLTALSQFQAQAELLLPPLSMLDVMKDPSTGKFMIHDKTEPAAGGGGTFAFKEIHVVPRFVMPM